MKIIQYRGALSPAAAQAELDSVYQSLATDAYGPFSLYRTPAHRLEQDARSAPSRCALGSGAPSARGVDSLDHAPKGARVEEPSGDKQ